MSDYELYMLDCLAEAEQEDGEFLPHDISYDRVFLPVEVDGRWELVEME